MANDFAGMDAWTDEEVQAFKDPYGAMPAGGFVPFGLEIADHGTVVAEGDSWFDYPPGTDLIDCLRRHHGYTIENEAEAGDTLENMIYGTRINRSFERVMPTIEKVLRRLERIRPKVLLFSGGGNDVAGDEFASYLNHKGSGLPNLRERHVQDTIHDVFRKYYEDLIVKVAAVSPETHIVTHGYGRTAPTGRAVNVLFIKFAGPWLRPALARKGIFDPLEQRGAVFRMIDEFNDLLAGLDRDFARFHFVDLRLLLDPDNDWANELHLKNSAYARCAEQIHETIEAL